MEIKVNVPAAMGMRPNKAANRPSTKGTRPNPVDDDLTRLAALLKRARLHRLEAQVALSFAEHMRDDSDVIAACRKAERDWLA